MLENIHELKYFQPITTFCRITW